MLTLLVLCLIIGGVLLTLEVLSLRDENKYRYKYVRTILTILLYILLIVSFTLFILGKSDTASVEEQKGAKASESGAAVTTDVAGDGFDDMENDLGVMSVVVPGGPVEFDLNVDNLLGTNNSSDELIFF